MTALDGRTAPYGPLHILDGLGFREERRFHQQIRLDASAGRLRRLGGFLEVGEVEVLVDAVVAHAVGCGLEADGYVRLQATSTKSPTVSSSTKSGSDSTTIRSRSAKVSAMARRVSAGTSRSSRKLPEV